MIIRLNVAIYQQRESAQKTLLSAGWGGTRLARRCRSQISWLLVQQQRWLGLLIAH